MFLWFSYGFPMVFPWFSHGFPMVSDIISISMVGSSAPHGSCPGDGNVASPGPPVGAVVEEILGLEDAVLMIDARLMGGLGDQDSYITKNYILYLGKL